MNPDARRYVILTFILMVGIIYASRLFYMQVVDDQWVLRAQEIQKNDGKLVLHAVCSSIEQVKKLFRTEPITT